MTVAFTGTREGMSDAQLFQLRNVFRWLSAAVAGTNEAVTFHHGGAVGADTQAAQLATEVGFKIVEHPAYDAPLIRNRRMAMLCDVLIAAPRADREELRSGTWATVRYARECRKPVLTLSR